MSLQIEQLAQGLLQSKGVDEILTILEVLRGLSTRYGSKLKLRCFQDEIVKVAPEIGQYLSFFEEIGRLKVGALDLLIKALLQHKQGIKVFEISTNDEEVVLPLKSFLDKQFGEVQLDYQPMVADTFSVKLK
ncbi:MAG: hypothetical protein Q4B28_00495 [bacterium]|nr:hypothetical protein [bacterium]